MMTPDRLKRSLAVAQKMKDIVMENPEKFEIGPNGAFVLGFVHDIGYSLTDDQEDHAACGGSVLMIQGYKYWQEVQYHGKIGIDYHSPELDLLNYADLITGPTGEYMSVSEQIKDIEKRYGKDSVQAENAKELAEKLSGKGIK